MKRLIYTAFVIVVLACSGIVAGVLVDTSSMREIAAFSTDIASRTPEQLHNIRRAAMRIDGVVLRPGEEFSFNREVGLCGVAQGYERAPTIVDGELRPSWGGGVCQVSSTLYNAALLADLKVTERHAHSRPVSSVPPGRDATAAFGVADLRFVNTTSSLIKLAADSSGTRLSIRVLGKARPDVNVDIETQVIRGATGWASGRGGFHTRLDSSIEGPTVRIYRTVSKGGRTIKRELISSDTYAGPASLAAAHQ